MSKMTEYYFDQFARGRISRREFLGRMTAAGLSATAISGLLTRQAKAETPKKGGKIVIGCEANTKETLEPATFASVAGLNTGFAVFDSLTSRAPDQSPIPWLAESWDTNQDATEWVFKLRQDVVYHDGQKFGADDVVYSYSRIIAPESESPVKGLLGHVAEVKKDDDHTVKFVLSSPDADFPSACGDHRSQVIQNGATEFARTASGTGPFKVKDFQPGVSYLLERNDDYWGDDGPLAGRSRVHRLGRRDGQAQCASVRRDRRARRPRPQGGGPDREARRTWRS